MQHAVAGHDDRDRVGAERVAGGAHGARAAGRVRHLLVGGELAVGDLGRGSAPAGEAAGQLPVERQPEARAAALEVLVQLALARRRSAGAPRGRAARSAPQARAAPPRGRSGSLNEIRTRPRGVAATSTGPTGESTVVYATSSRPSFAARSASRPAAAPAAAVTSARPRPRQRRLQFLHRSHVALSFFNPSCRLRRAASSEQPRTRPSRRAAGRWRSAARPRRAACGAAPDLGPQAGVVLEPVSARASGIGDGQRPAPVRAVGVDRLAVRDREHPRPQVGVAAQPRVRAQGRQERLLEAVVGLLAADRRHQEPVHVIAVLIEEHLEWRH